MRVPFLVSEFFEWRWAPCVGLTAGSLGFVALALLLIPSRVDGGAAVTERSSSFESQRPRQAMYSSALTSTLSETERATEPAPSRHAAPRFSLPSREANAAPARGFSPVIDRPESQPLPAAVEPPAPAPVPGSVVVIQPVPGGESRIDNR